MATDLGPTVNGMYGAQYGQPAELAASVPTSTQPATTPQPSSESASNPTKADPQEIGWYFVEQYYTTLSKHPDRIHLFYSTKSQLVTGVEAEKVLPSVGQKVSFIQLLEFLHLPIVSRQSTKRSRNSISKTAKSEFSMSILRTR